MQAPIPRPVVPLLRVVGVVAEPPQRAVAAAGQEAEREAVGAEEQQALVEPPNQGHPQSMTNCAAAWVAASPWEPASREPAAGSRAVEAELRRRPAERARLPGLAGPAFREASSSGWVWANLA